MISSRNLFDLLPPVRLMAMEFVHECKVAGFDLLITSTYRDKAAQNALFAQGRTTKGAIVTNARGGQSFHQYRVALDVVPMLHGKPVWSLKGQDRLLWEKTMKIGEKIGFESASRWHSNPEWPHFQYTGGLTLADYQAGKTLNA